MECFHSIICGPTREAMLQKVHRNLQKHNLKDEDVILVPIPSRKPMCVSVVGKFQNSCLLFTKTTRKIDDNFT